MPRSIVGGSFVGDNVYLCRAVIYQFRTMTYDGLKGLCKFPAIYCIVYPYQLRNIIRMQSIGTKPLTLLLNYTVSA